MISYGAFIWWKGTLTLSANRLLNHLQRTACLAITGASSSCPQAALDSLLFLPSLDSYIQAEAKVTAFRLKHQINEIHLNTTNTHCSILTELFESSTMLNTKLEKTVSIYHFVKQFGVHRPVRDDFELLNTITQSTDEVWFTDASVTQVGCGYGYYNLRNETSKWGYIGKTASVLQAEVTAIFNCAIEIAQDTVSTTTVWICTDSTAALNALNAVKLTSKLIIECVRLLELISARRPINLLWVPSHANVVGNEIADSLAKRGARTSTDGAEPFLPLEENRIRACSNSWLQDQIPVKWSRVLTCSHTKKFLTRPNEKLSYQLLRLDKRKLRIVIGIITGHFGLNAFLARMGIRADPDCDHCGHIEETAFHFLCKCPGFSETRRHIYGNSAITTEVVMGKPLSKIFAFAQLSNRLPSGDVRMLHQLSLSSSRTGPISNHRLDSGRGYTQ